VHTYAAAGAYVVTLTVFDGNCATTSSQTITVGTVNLNENSSGLYGLNISPNPSKDYFNLEYQLVNPSNVKIEILNVIGEKLRQVADEMQLAGKHVFDLRGIAPGTYFIRLTSNDKIITQRIVKL
jgi:PKD repeat protein